MIRRIHPSGGHYTKVYVAIDKQKFEELAPRWYIELKVKLSDSGRETDSLFLPIAQTAAQGLKRRGLTAAREGFAACEIYVSEIIGDREGLIELCFSDSGSQRSVMVRVESAKALRSLEKHLNEMYNNMC